MLCHALFGLLLFPLVAALRGRGSASVVLHFKGTRSSHSYPLTSHAAFTLWCSPEGPATIESALFQRKSDGRKHVPTVSEDGRNATWTLTHPSIADAGEWECKLETSGGHVVHPIPVYARPVAHPHGTETYSLIDDKENHLRGATVGIPLHASLNVTCPAIGHPTPNIIWLKDGQMLTTRSATFANNGTTVVIKDATEANAGVYSCQAKNEFRAGSVVVSSLLIVEKQVKVKGEFAWVVPLIAIIVIILLLLASIFICEFRRKRREQLLNQYEPAEE